MSERQFPGCEAPNVAPCRDCGAPLSIGAERCSDTGAPCMPREQTAEMIATRYALRAGAIEARADRARTAPLVIPREHETAVLAALALAALTYAIPDGPGGPLAALDALAPGAADSLRESIAKRNADADAERREGRR